MATAQRSPCFYSRGSGQVRKLTRRDSWWRAWLNVVGLRRARGTVCEAHVDLRHSLRETMPLSEKNREKLHSCQQILIDNLTTDSLSALHCASPAQTAVRWSDCRRPRHTESVAIAEIGWAWSGGPHNILDIGQTRNCMAMWAERFMPPPPPPPPLSLSLQNFGT